MRTQYSAPPTHSANSLAHRQSENPMARTADSQPPKIVHVESEQTTSARLRKLPTQLNTPNRFDRDLVWLSKNASDVQQFGWCVPAFTCGWVPYGWDWSFYEGQCWGKGSFLMTLNTEAVRREVVGTHKLIWTIAGTLSLKMKCNHGLFIVL